VAVTVKLVDVPSPALWLDGCNVIEGAPASIPWDSADEVLGLKLPSPL
jgi:hypothetical protein